LLGCCIIAAGVGLILVNYGGADAAQRTVPPVSAPESDAGNLSAQAVVDSNHGDRTEVRVQGKLHGVAVDEVVFRATVSPDLLRLGWQDPSHLTITIPQYPQEAGSAPGAGDPNFRCAADRQSPVSVRCDTYAIGPH
jgi:hypothetical protein